MTSLDDYLADPRFSRTFELPPDHSSNRPGSFTIKYADYGYRNEVHPEQENVLLFFGSLMGSRLAHVAKDEIAKNHKIRIINPDRPGIGGTDAVDEKHRMELWLATIALLRYLDIHNVSLGCHSGGTIYALDLLLHHPELLHPIRPYLAIGAPWILPLHTNSKAMSIVQSLPASVIAKTDKFARFVNNYLGPILGLSFGLTKAAIDKLMLPFPKSQHEDMNHEDINLEGAAFEDDLCPRIIDRMYLEGLEGMSSDALLFMQKIDGMTGWGNWGDYDVLVPRLAAALGAAGRRLHVDVFYAEEDFMNGTNGPQWFDQCWGSQHRGSAIDYASTTVRGADHNGIWALKWDAVHAMFSRISQSVE